MKYNTTQLKSVTRQKIYEGSSKIIYQSDDECALVQFFKDEFKYKSTSYNISGKGIINNSISALLMERLDLACIDNHFIEKLNMREQLVQVLDIIPIQIRISNVAIDHYVTHYGVQEGYLFSTPMIEFRAKNPIGGYPVINEEQIIGFQWSNRAEMKMLKKQVLQVNNFLTGFFAGCGLRLVECYLEFGRVFNGEEFLLMLADELSLETCRVWDLHSNDKIDSESIANNLDNALELYKAFAKRIGCNIQSNQDLF